MVNSNRIVIEGVYEDLWNLVTENKRDVTIIIKDNVNCIDGNCDFFTIDEIEMLKVQACKAKKFFSKIVNEGATMLLEWSFAYNTDPYYNKIGEQNLIFYEAREV